MHKRRWGEPEEVPEVIEIPESDFEAILQNKQSLSENYELTLDPVPAEYRDSKSKERVPDSCCTSDPVVLHIIKLNQHGKVMQDLISKAKEGFNSEGVLPEPPAIPKMPLSLQQKPKNIFRYLDKDFSSFSGGVGPSLPELTKETTRKLLKRSVIQIMAQTGYDVADSSALQVVADVAEEFMTKMTKLLRFNVDKMYSTGYTSGFADVMDRAFHEMGIGSIQTVHDFYQTDVLGHHQSALQACQQLHEEYEGLQSMQSLLNQASEFYQDGSEDVDVPEIHFPAPEDGEDVFLEANQTLEPGFQMLESLEQDEASNAVIGDIKMTLSQ